MTSITKLRTIPDFAKLSPLSDAQLRWIRFNSATNGADDYGVFRQIGRRVYIDPDAFDKWVDSGRASQRMVTA